MPEVSLLDVNDAILRVYVCYILFACVHSHYIILFKLHDLRQLYFTDLLWRGEEQNREEGEMAQKRLGGGRNRGEKVGRREKK